MKYYYLILGLFLLFSCGNQVSETSRASSKEPQPYTQNQLENLSISFDTLLVDVGDELINAGAYYGFGLSEDRQSIYMADGQNTEVHQIDLEELRLIRQIKFQKDGPNQAPDYINDFQVLPGEEFLLSNGAIQGIYNDEGQRIQNLKIEAEPFAGILDDLGSLSSSLFIGLDKAKAFSLPAPFAGFTKGLAVLDLKARTAEVLELPALELTKDYRVTFSQNGGTTISGDMIRLKKIRNDLVIYSGSTSDLYVYDLETDTLKLIRNDHQLVASRKTGTFKTQVGSHEERVEEVGKMRRQINFYAPFWDETRRQFFRFGAKEKGFDESGNRRSPEIFLFSYDDDFRLLGETKVDELPNLFFNSFFLEGKLYNYLPIDEEPGFVVLTLNF